MYICTLQHGQVERADGVFGTAGFSGVFVYLFVCFSGLNEFGRWWWYHPVKFFWRSGEQGVMYSDE